MACCHVTLSCLLIAVVTSCDGTAAHPPGSAGAGLQDGGSAAVTGSSGSDRTAGAGGTTSSGGAAGTDGGTVGIAGGRAGGGAAGVAGGPSEAGVIDAAGGVGDSRIDAGYAGGAGATSDARAEGAGPPPPGGSIQTVFVVLEENHDWSSIKQLPYIQHLLQIGAHSEQYYNPKGLHPSEPNYIWMEGGSNFGKTDDSDPATNLVKGAKHLAILLDAAGVSWTSYQESISAGTCPVTSGGRYAAKHNPFVFFDDIVGVPPSATNSLCIAHHKPFSQFVADLKAGKVARYNFITPNLDDDMHDGTPAAGDSWLKANIDPIINPADPNHNPNIYAHAVVIITFDEGTGKSDGPIGLIVVSPFAKQGFQDTATPMPYFYTHSSLLLSLQKIFGVSGTPLGDAANARDLSALFTSFP
jgi:hypothetical protein